MADNESTASPEGPGRRVKGGDEIKGERERPEASLVIGGKGRLLKLGKLGKKRKRKSKNGEEREGNR